MIYITKCSIYLNFIHRYSQLFVVVSSCHGADVPSVSDFVPNPESCPHLWPQPLLLSVSVVIPNLHYGVEEELCL